MKVSHKLLCGNNWYSKFWSLFQSPALLVIRLIWGCLFLQAGVGKWMDMGQTIENFTNFGIMYPMFNAYLVATVETLGGICLILGFLTRVAALPLLITMIVAVITVHYEPAMQFLFKPDQFLAEYPFTFLYSSLILLVFGPGLFSIDALCICKTCSKEDESTGS